VAVAVVEAAAEEHHVAGVDDLAVVDAVATAMAAVEGAGELNPGPPCVTHLPSEGNVQALNLRG
jgi:hypothetical protein